MSISSDTPSLTERTCCLCGPGAQKKLFLQIGQHRLLRCGSCRLVFLSDPAVRQDQFYNDVSGAGATRMEYWGLPEYYEKHRVVFDSFFEERWNRISHYVSCPHSLLDVGAGHGFWLSYCANRAERARGIDLADNVVEYARNSLGLLIDRCDIEKDACCCRRGEYDVITLCDVLEHLNNPLLALKRLNQALSQNGVLYLQVPSELQRFSYPMRKQWGLPHHVWHFEERTLRRLIEAAGFRWIDSWAGVQGVIQAYEQGGPSTSQRALWFLARKYRFGNRLQVLVRKDLRHATG